MSMRYKSDIKQYAMDLLEADEQITHPESITDIQVFSQLWSSTALGFNGIGGQMMTTASTIVVMQMDKSTVFFGGRKAYVVKPDLKGHYNKAFFDDLYIHRRMKSVAEAKVYDYEQ